MKNASEAKLRGGFYTPPLIAKFILKWAVNGNKDYAILEPSCGDGIFLEQIKSSDFESKARELELKISESRLALRARKEVGLTSEPKNNWQEFNYCSKCGGKYTGDVDKFCAYCGKKRE